MNRSPVDAWLHSIGPGALKKPRLAVCKLENRVSSPTYRQTALNLTQDVPAERCSHKHDGALQIETEMGKMAFSTTGEDNCRYECYSFECSH